MNKKSEISWKDYSNVLPLADKIYLGLFGEPKTHVEWADKFNKVGGIVRLIIKETK
jgi:hypothetical protein